MGKGEGVGECGTVAGLGRNKWLSMAGGCGEDGSKYCHGSITIREHLFMKNCIMSDQNIIS